MTSEVASQSSITTTPCIDRPMSRFSAASEAATFYSALDSPLSPSMSSNSVVSPVHTKSDTERGVRKPRSKKCIQENVSPKLIRQDSGYAAYTSSTLSSLKTPSPKLPNSKHHSKSNLLRKSQRGPRNRSSLPQLHKSQPYRENYKLQSSYQRSKFEDKRPKYLIDRRYFSEVSSFTQAGFNTKKNHSSDENSSASNSPPPFPSTINYWTSDDSRRLEYAAIDAASKGVRGFLVRIVPDFILPSQARRTRFWGLEGEGKQREGSVRRYRLALPEEPAQIRTKKVSQKKFGSRHKERSSNRPGILRRWSTGLKTNQN